MEVINMSSIYNAGPVYSGIHTLLGLPYDKDAKDADVALYGMPFDISTTNRTGCRFGPEGIRPYGQCKPYHEELDIDIFDDFKAVDTGDFAIPLSYVERDMDAVENQLYELLEKGVKTIGVGGDHTLSYPELLALKRKFGKVAFVHFDSHTDTWDWPDENGNTLINHGTPFRLAIQHDCIDMDHAIQIGMRGGFGTLEDHDFALEHGMQIIFGNELHEMGMSACAKRIREVVGDTPVFVTFDIDFLDPAVAPGTGTPIVGGFTTAEALQILREGLTGLNIVAMDLVEVAPAYDPTGQTQVVANEILREFLSILSYNKKAGK
jgi:agmatinase